MKMPDWKLIWQNSPGLRRSVIVILLLCLAVIVSGCSSSPVHKAQYLTPDPAWVQPTVIYLGIQDLQTYEAVRNKALTEALSAVGRCNADKAALRAWMQKAKQAE